MTYAQLIAAFPFLQKMKSFGTYLVEISQGTQKLNIKVNNGSFVQITRKEFDTLLNGAGVNAHEIHFEVNEVIFRIPQEVKGKFVEA